MKRAILFAMALAVLAGCGRGGSAPVVHDRDIGQLRTLDAQGRPVSGPGVHTVARGETLSGIAARYGVATEVIAGVNGLERPDRLRVGQRLRIPRVRQYRVRRGDTVYDIARRYGTPIRAVIEVNDLDPPYILSVGETIRLPQPRVHIVRRGDTLYDISRRHGVNLSDLARLNGLAPPYTIRPGQELALPSPEGSPREVQVASRGPRTTPAGRETEPAGQAERRSRTQDQRSDTADSGTQRRTVARTPPKPPPKPDVKPAAIRRAANAQDTGQATGQATRQARAAPDAVPQPEARSRSRFAWPLRGEILAGYGPQEGGLHNDGLNIAADRGAPVSASENGVVAYVGNELRGFGNLILLKHADNWITAYAHLDAIEVERGQKVERGDRIGRAGSSGGVSRPQLHFETRRGSDAVDPKKVLGTLQARLL